METLQGAICLIVYAIDGVVGATCCDAGLACYVDGAVQYQRGGQAFFTCARLDYPVLDE